MTKDEITAMAMDAGLMFRCPERLALYASEYVASIERFAALVAEKEREKCAQVCEGMRTAPPNGEPEDVERGFNAALRRSAAAIRARGQKEGT